MSGRRRRYALCPRRWPTAAASPCSGIPTAEVPIDFTPIMFNMLTLKGIYGREMYETWYQMSVMVQSGLDIRPVITHRFSLPRLRGGVLRRRLG